jgi:hypothetical protein
VGNSDRHFATNLQAACQSGFGLQWPIGLVSDEVVEILDKVSQVMDELLNHQSRFLLSDDLVSHLEKLCEYVDRAKVVESHEIKPKAFVAEDNFNRVSAFIQIAAALDPQRSDITDGRLKGLALRLVAIPQLYSRDIKQQYGDIFTQFAALFREIYTISPEDTRKFIESAVAEKGEQVKNKLHRLLDNDRDVRIDMKRLAAQSRADRRRHLGRHGDLGTMSDTERLKPFARLLRSIADTLSRRQNEAYLSETTDGLNRLAAKFAENVNKQPGDLSTSSGNFSAASEFTETFNRDGAQWRSALKALIRWNRNEDPHGRLVVQEMFREVGGIDERRIFDVLVDFRQKDETSLDLYRKAADVVAKAFAGHWVADDNLMDSRIGGEKGLYQDLLYLRPDVFSEGAVENPLRTDSLVVILPRAPGIENETGTNNRDGLRGHLRKITQKALNTTAISPGNSDIPVVYFEQLYRAPQEISRIELLYRSYITVDPSLRRFFHIAKDSIADLMPILRDQSLNKPVYCGNVGCRREIRHLPMQVLSCPDCQKPIWNRCGNSQCPADDVMTLVDLKRAGRPPEEKVSKCPYCGDGLETYFWTCPDPTHSTKLIERDKEVCPHCIAEHNEGKRPSSRIHTRPDMATLKCPGCPDYAKSTTAVPADMKRYFTDGVNGGSSISISCVDANVTNGMPIFAPVSTPIGTSPSQHARRTASTAVPDTTSTGLAMLIFNARSTRRSSFTPATVVTRLRWKRQCRVVAFLGKPLAHAVEGSCGIARCVRTLTSACSTRSR